MVSHDSIRAAPDAFAIIVVIIVIEVQALSQRILNTGKLDNIHSKCQSTTDQAMQLMECLCLRNEAATIGRSLLRHSWQEADLLCFALGYDVSSLKTSVDRPRMYRFDDSDTKESKVRPYLVDFFTCVFSIDRRSEQS